MKKHKKLFVKIYNDKESGQDVSIVEDAKGNELKTGPTETQHGNLIKWAAERALKVDYDS